MENFAQPAKISDLSPTSDISQSLSNSLRSDLLISEQSTVDPRSLIDIVNEISNLGEYKSLFKSDCGNLIRRIKLLAPLFEEVKEFKGALAEQAISSLRAIEKALQDARDLLKLCYFGSKLYLVLERESVVNKFWTVTRALEHALDDVPYDLFEISDEVREQVELVHTQLKRAKGRAEMQDQEVYNIAEYVLADENDAISMNAALERLAEKLHLKTLSEIKQEKRALDHILATKTVDQISERRDDMIILLTRLQDLSINDNGLLDVLHENEDQSEKISSPIIPDDFRCPISLELMKDPVIVATGQTYERSCIQKWLDAGNKTCPKTQQILPHLILTPNYVLKSLITQWCETHGIELPQKSPSGDRQTIEVLLEKLSGPLDVQRAAAGEIRMLAKRNAENRVCIAEAGAIPKLIALLSSPDSRTQEHAVTALLNLSIHETNKGEIVQKGAIVPIVDVLKNGSMEARENAAATLFSLSVVDENKIAIGNSGAIPALVSLLCDGTLRGKKDAATALFNLSIYQGNKPKAVKAGVIPPLIKLLVDPSLDMVDEALAILAILATHQDGRSAISQASAIPILVDLIRTGSPRNKENAAAVLVALCTNDPVQTAIVIKHGGQGPLNELLRSGTARARRKALALLDLVNKHERSTSDLA